MNNNNNKLWYTTFSDEYISGLPIGTGRLAGMVYGEPTNEKMGLNHEWLWRGVHRNRENVKSAHLLSEVRKLILAGNYSDGSIKANEAFGGGGGCDPTGSVSRVDAYQPAGDFSISLEHGDVLEYRRELDLETASVKVSYCADGQKFIREYIAHIELDILLVRISSDSTFNGAFSFSRVTDDECFLNFQSLYNKLIMDGQFEGGIGFRTEAQLLHNDGSGEFFAENIVVKNATEVIFAVNIGTSANGYSPAEECNRFVLPVTNWQSLLESHISAYKK